MYGLLVRLCLTASLFTTVLAILLATSHGKWNRVVCISTNRCNISRGVFDFFNANAATILNSFAGRTKITDLVHSPYIKPCKKSDPDINKCITRSIDQLRDKLSVGIPELEAPGIEPLTLKQIRLSRGPVGARLDVNLTDLRVSGPSTFKVRDLEADVENVVFTFKVGFDKLGFQGKYQIDARVLLLHLAGQGDLTGTFMDYDSDVVLRARKVFRDNDVYLNFEKMKVKIKIGKANLHFSNLFGGDTVLAAASHELLNNNNGLLLDEITPVLETSLAELFTDVANKITKSFTYKELFPSD